MHDDPHPSAPAATATPPPYAAPPSSADESVPWRALARVGAAVLTVLTAFGALLPVFPVWVRGLANSDTEVGLVTTLATGVGLVAGRPLAARLMEGRARRPTLAAGVVLCAAACALFPVAGSLTVVLGLRGLLGVGFALVTTAGVSAITDLAPAARRGQIMGLYGAGNALSLVLGPVLGAGLRALGGFDLVFWGAAALALGAFGALWGMVESIRPDTGPPVGGLRAVFAFPIMRRLVPAHGVAMLLHGAVVTLLPLRLAERPDGPTPEMFFILDAAAVVALRIAVGKRFDTAGRLPFIVAGLVLLAAGGAIVAVFRDTGAVALGAVLYGLGFGAYVPAMNALVGDAVPPSHRVRGFAMYFLAFDLALACGGVVVGPVADAYHRGVALGLAALAPLVALTVIWPLRPRLPRAPAG